MGPLPTVIAASDWVDASPDPNIIIGGSAGNITLTRNASGTWAHFSSDDSTGSSGDPMAVSFTKEVLGSTAQLIGFAASHPAEITNVPHALIASGSGGGWVLRYRPDGNSGNDVVSATAVTTGDNIKMEYVPTENGGTLKFYKNDVEVIDLQQTGVGTNENFIGVATSNTAILDTVVMSELKVWR
jgi:hypothetical protein